jgi:glucose/arabinose dehydrogenase
MYRLARGREVDGVLGEMAVLGDFAPAEAGGSGALRFGADGKLYMVLSDLLTDAAPASEASYRGKVLRLDDAGRTPDDSPRGSPIFSSGHRHASGLAAGPLDGRLFEAETARGGRIHVLSHGTRYSADASQRGEAPLVDLGLAARPGGLLVYSGRGFPRWQGDLLVARLDGDGITRVPLNGGPVVAVPIPSLSGVYGRIRSLVEAADGSLYFGTANGEAGASAASHDDDRVMRLAPARAEAPRIRVPRP